MRPVASPAKNAFKPTNPTNPAQTPGKKYPLQEREGAIHVRVASRREIPTKKPMT